MAVPDFQVFMLPALQFFADGKTKTLRDTAEFAAKELELTEADRMELAGRKIKYKNRTYWALTYLTQAGVLAYAGRGQRMITDRGKEVLARGLLRLDRKVLREFEEFRQFEGRSKAVGSDSSALAAESIETSADPEEALEEVYRRVQEPKRTELLHAVLRQSPTFFEKLVLDVLTATGYGGRIDDPALHLGASGDGGVDGVIKEDALGLELVYVQAKRYEPSQSVGRPAIQQFAGSLDGVRARKGVFITTATFTRDAREYARHIEKRIALIDGDALLDLMLKHGVGCRTVKTYDVKAIDQDYFEE